MADNFILRQTGKQINLVYVVFFYNIPFFFFFFFSRCWSVPDYSFFWQIKYKKLHRSQKNTIIIYKINTVESRDKETCPWNVDRPTATNRIRSDFFTNIKSRWEITITLRNTVRDVYLGIYWSDRANGSLLLNQLSSFKYPQKQLMLRASKMQIIRLLEIEWNDKIRSIILKGAHH